MSRRRCASSPRKQQHCRCDFPPCCAVQEPEGLLEVQVVQAVNLPRMDFWGGKADPYVRSAAAAAAAKQPCR